MNQPAKISWLNHIRCNLSYREMLSLGWQLTWPALCLDTAWSVITHGLLDLHDSAMEAVFAIPYLLFIGPWLIKRMFSLHYDGFQLKTFRGGQPALMNHAEAFKVFWLLSWRVMVPMLLLLFVVSFFLRFVQVDLASLVPSSKDAPLFNAVGLTLVENTAALFLLPFVFPGMFAKRYQGFRVASERKPNSGLAQAGHKQHAAKHQKRA